MDKLQIIETLVKGFENRLCQATDAVLYSIYAEYLRAEEEMKLKVTLNNEEGVTIHEI